MKAKPQQQMQSKRLLGLRLLTVVQIKVWLRSQHIWKVSALNTTSFGRLSRKRHGLEADNLPFHAYTFKVLRTHACSAYRTNHCQHQWLVLFLSRSRFAKKTRSHTSCHDYNHFHIQRGLVPPQNNKHDNRSQPMSEHSAM